MSLDKTKISIIIPCKDEAEGLRKIIRSIRKYSDDIIVMDGHSKDNTKQIVTEEKTRYFLDHGKGRGEAVRDGFKKAKNEYILVFDADGSSDYKDIPKILSPLFKENADLVIGSRRTGGSFDLKMDFMGLIRSSGSDFLVYLVNRRFNADFSDILFGFRALKKSKVAKLNLKANGHELEQEMVVNALKKGLKIVEVPSRENARKWGKSKLKTLTGIKFIFHLLNALYFS
ncbi:MAG TPA: glycosyltransferase [Candidatus Sulfotelmatobacter sp.]|nr:glycosyltransferase [Candidatus Sulfotelmatobacter sp.]